MRKRLVVNIFIYFLCVSFLVMMNGFSGLAQAREQGIPIGEMVSKGEVKFEVRENVWKEVEPSQFPLFPGTKIKTEKGVADVTLSNNIRIDASPNSLFSLDQEGQFVLSQGSIEFRIPSASEINFKVGNLSILKSRTLQAAKDLSTVRNEEVIGSISFHTNGSVTIKSVQGKLTVMNQDQVVVAAVSKDSITIPSITVGAKPPVMVAQTGTGTGEGGGSGGGLSTGGAVLIGLGGLAVAGGVVWAVSDTTKSEDEEVVCH